MDLSIYVIIFMFLLILWYRTQRNSFETDLKKEKERSLSLQEQVDSLQNNNKQLQKKLVTFYQNFDNELDQKIVEKVSTTRYKPQYEAIPIFRNFSEIPLHDGRFMRSVKENMRIRDFKASALITTETDHTYRTTLTQCECVDFRMRGKPCKHMYRLAMELGLLIGVSIEDNHYIADLYARETRVTEAEENFEKEKSNFQKIMDSQKQSCPYLANLFADYYYFQDLKLENYLKYKSPPALKAAENVKILANEKREITKELKLAEYQLNFYESLFPWLLDFKEVSPQDAVASTLLGQADSEYSCFKKYLSPQEFNSLSHTEKIQLALDRYQRRKKTNWDVGIEYERYVGYLYEKDGYTVSYSGALEGLKDMGRDLVVKSKNKIEIIQCKRWAQEKVIHEKHIFQLYGSVVLYQIQNPKRKVSGIFYTTTSLSQTAKECAEYLGIKYYENFLYQDYPFIKCNISKTGEKIYHLPFDQRYDSIFITPKKGDLYVSTVQEAENLGFRHAYKWKPTHE